MWFLNIADCKIVDFTMYLSLFVSCSVYTHLKPVIEYICYSIELRKNLVLCI